MAATAALGFRWLCLPLLLVLVLRGALAQLEAAVHTSLPVANRLGDGRGPEESSNPAVGADGSGKTEPAPTEDATSQVVMKVSDTANRHNASVHHRQYISPEESAAASLPDVARLVALAAAHLEAGSACGEDSRAFLRALQNFTLWAVQMYDSSVRAPSGVVYGSVYQLGHFDQCVAVRADAGRLRGQYCLPEVGVRPLPSEPQPLPADPYSLHFPQEQSAWLKLQFAGDLMKIRRDRWWWALCVPASCSPRQLQRALNAALRAAGPRMRVEMRAHLRSDHCSTDEPPQPTPCTVIFQCVVTALLVLAAIGSYYDGRENNTDSLKSEKTKGYGRQIIECFSVRRNFRLLMTISKSNLGLDIFGFLRTFSMMCMIIGHRLILYGGYPLYNGEAEDELFRHPTSMLVAGGILLVDVCFTMGAITLTILLFHNFDRGGKFHHLFLDIINRYVRLTPLHAVVILFHIGVLPYLGSGPLWKYTVLRDQTRCETNWWTNILYVNNYVNPTDMCLFQSWYMSVDFQLFVVCIFLGYLMWRWRVAGWVAMGIITIISMVLPFLTIYTQHLDPLMMPYPEATKNFRDVKEFLKLHVPSHNRATPYLIGVMAGTLMHYGRNLKWKMNEVQSYLVFIAGCSAALGLYFSEYIFFIPGRPYNAFEAAIFRPLQHSAIAVLTCIYGSYSVISNSKSLMNFLSAKVFVILGRLSFAAYMIHSIPMLYDQGSLRQPRHVGIYECVWLSLADLCITYPMAVVVFVLIESPFRGVMKVLLQGIK